MVLGLEGKNGKSSKIREKRTDNQQKKTMLWTGQLKGN